MITRYLLCFFAFAILQLQALDFNCPYGCGDTENDSEISEISQIFAKCLEDTNMLQERKFPAGAGSHNTLDGTRSYPTIGYFYWDVDITEEEFIHCDDDEDEDENEIIHIIDNYLFDHRKWDPPSNSYVREDMKFEGYSSCIDIFNALNFDVESYFTAEIDFYEHRLHDVQKDLSIIEEKKPIARPDLFHGFSRDDLKILFERDLTQYSKNLNKLKNERLKVFPIIEKARKEIDATYLHIYEWCFNNHQWNGLLYQRGMLYFYQGEIETALEDIKSLIEVSNTKKEQNNLKSEIFLLKGQCNAELGLYHDAILALTEAIQKNPTNTEAYFERASSYFELGEFDLAIQDYILNKQSLSLTHLSDGGMLVFGAGFSKGAANGLAVSVNEFVPSALASLNGLGNLIWATLQHPIDTPKQMISATIEFCDYLRGCSTEEIAAIAALELTELISNWDNLDNKQRGEQAGYVLGKYGIDFLTPYAMVKGAVCIKTLREIKRADKLFTLECLSKSPELKTATIENAAKWNENRSRQISQIKIEINKQTKHIEGSWNFEPEKKRSLWTHPKPQDLLEKHAGRGQKIIGVSGQAGYRERVDFGEIIGIYIDEKTGLKTPTTRGIIHYSEKGAHIVPSTPKLHI